MPGKKRKMSPFEAAAINNNNLNNNGNSSSMSLSSSSMSNNDNNNNDAKRTRKTNNSFAHFKKLCAIGNFPSTDAANKTIEAARRAFLASDRRIAALKKQNAKLKEQQSLSPAKPKIWNDGTLSTRAVKRCHIDFKPVAVAADNYFKKLLDEQGELNLAELNKIVREADKNCVERNTQLGQSTHADKNKKWTLKDEMSVVLMLAMRATGSQRTLKHFRQYFSKHLNFSLADCWSLNPFPGVRNSITNGISNNNRDNNNNNNQYGYGNSSSSSRQQNV